MEKTSPFSAPLRQFSRLVAATTTQRRKVEIDPDGQAFHWPELDEDIDVALFLACEAIVTSLVGPLPIADDSSLQESRVHNCVARTGSAPSTSPRPCLLSAGPLAVASASEEVPTAAIPDP